MNEIRYLSFKDVDSEDLLRIVNEDALRTHLVAHAYFDSASVREWMADKMTIDSLPGCRIRAVEIGGSLAGWCGIQPDDAGFELAIVISREFWGYGIRIFRALIGWASELGHEEVLFHLLDSRPEYMALRKLANKVQKTELSGRVFTTYFVSVCTS